MTAVKPRGWFSGRTRIVTIASVVAVGIAGATAVGANIGILDKASDSAVGQASAAGELAAPGARVVDVYVPEGTPVSAVPGSSAAGVQDFAVDLAGTVGVAATGGGVRLDHVAPADGWTWTLSQTDPAALVVTMTNGSRTFEFHASLTADGSIAARVSEPVDASSSVRTSHDDDDDDHDDDHGDDHGATSETGKTHDSKTHDSKDHDSKDHDSKDHDSKDHDSKDHDRDHDDD